MWEVNKMTKIPWNISNDQKYSKTSKMTKKKKTLKPLERQKKYFQNLKNEQKHLETSKMIRNSSKLVKWPKYPPKSL